LSEFANPYRPGEPVTDPAMLFGRQEAADWIQLQIESGNRTLVLSASPLIGKTSLLHHVGFLQNNNAFNMLVSLADVPALQRVSSRDLKAEDHELSVSSVLRVVLGQVSKQFCLLRLIDQPPTLSSSQVAGQMRGLFAQACFKLSATDRLVLYLDDLHLLVGDDLALVSNFLTSLMPLLDECVHLHLVFAANSDQLKRVRHPLLDGAPVYNLGPLPPDASVSMVTQPVKDILRFDYGITKRIAEVNSHHPHYLTLFCHLLLNRQIHDGWVNQQDFDNTLVEILDSPIEPFRQVWDKSTWAERGVLSGMAAIQGAHGPITNQEVVRFLQRQNPNVTAEVVLDSLENLSERGVLVLMGAVSYRFHVELFRFWLRQHTNPQQILAEVNWGRAAAELRSARGDYFSTRPISPGAPAEPNPQPAKKATPKWLWLAAALSLAFCALLTGGGVAAARLWGLTLPLIGPPSTATRTQEVAFATATVTGLADAGSEAGALPVPTGPTLTPTPTPALVVAKSLPSITFMGRDVDEDWLIYVMNADGSNPTPLSPAGGDDTGPVWSADGRRIAFVSRRDGNREIYVMNSDGSGLANVTRHPADDWTPTWSPDGTQLAFSSFRNGSWEIYGLDTACLAEPASCPEAVTQITDDDNGNLSPVYSPDGSRIAFNSKASGNWDLYSMAADGTDIRQITTDEGSDLAPAWSPDGSMLAFESSRDGNVEVYVVSSAGGLAQNITNLPLADDHGPTWSPDGQRILFYSNREGNWDIFATTIDGGLVSNLTQTPARDEQTPAWRP
jgi:TolB protein